MQKRKNNKLPSIQVLAILLAISQINPLYKDVEDHRNREIILAGNEPRIQNTDPTFKFFISFWVRSTKNFYFRASKINDLFTLQMNLGSQNDFAFSADASKLMKNFCWNFLIRGKKTTQAVDREVIVRLQLTAPAGPPNYIVHQEITHHFYFYANQGANPNKMESYITMTNGGTPTKFYEKTNLYSGDNKEVDITSCYSKIYMSETFVYHAFYLEMIAKDVKRPDTISEETAMREYLWEKSIDPKINLAMDSKDFKFKTDVSIGDWSQDFTVFIKNFKTMDGGMIEHAEASHHVSLAGNEGSIPYCTMEIDSQKRRCLNCIGTRFFNVNHSGKCEPCSSMIGGCKFCHEFNVCDTCENYKDVFGSSKCFTNIRLCAEPKYSRFNQERCDSCQHSSPNTCRCGANSELVDSSLGGDRKMCSCKIANCKQITNLNSAF